MSSIIVVETPETWILENCGAEVISAFEYISNYSTQKNIRVFNLCESYKYQSLGYYVSLLASARGHKPIPSINTIQDMKSPSWLRSHSEALQELIQKTLKDIKNEQFTLSIYFGHNVAKKYDKLAREIYKSFHSPLLRARFVQQKDGTWLLTVVSPIALKDVPASHLPDLKQFAAGYFERRSPKARKKSARFSMAILVNPEEKLPPSNEKALQKFIKAAQKQSIEAELIEPSDLRILGEYDALFIRETTAVNHHTFRFAQKAAANGMVVIDDPESILKCTNKVYLAELLKRNQIPIPKTFVLHRHNVESQLSHLPMPCVLKRPDSAFSVGVIKSEDEASLKKHIEEFLKDSDLIIAQEYLPTEFDWRVGLIDGEVFYLSRYYMARAHWQIYKQEGNGKVTDGKADCVPIVEAPRRLLDIARKAGRLIGKSLYGIDIKEVNGEFYVIEINDNPSIDAGVEDRLIRDAMYEHIIGVFSKRLMAKAEGAQSA